MTLNLELVLGTREPIPAPVGPGRWRQELPCPELNNLGITVEVEQDHAYSKIHFHGPANTGTVSCIHVALRSAPLAELVRYREISDEGTEELSLEGHPEIALANEERFYALRQYARACCDVGWGALLRAGIQRGFNMMWHRQVRRALRAAGAIEILRATAADVAALPDPAAHMEAVVWDGVELPRNTPLMATVDYGHFVALDLREVHLSGSARRTEFVRVEAPGVQCHTADFTGAIFASCNFRGATFTNCSFHLAAFIMCDLRGATFTNCFLPGTHFASCNLRGAHFPGSRRIAGSWDSDNVREAVARRGELAPMLQEILAGDEVFQVRAALAARENLVPAVQETLARDASQDVRYILAGNPTLDHGAEKILTRDADWRVRGELAWNPRLRAPHQAALAKDASEHVLARLAVNPRLAPSLQEILARDKSTWVRAALARNPRLVPAAWRALEEGDEIRRSKK